MDARFSTASGALAAKRRSGSKKAPARTSANIRDVYFAMCKSVDSPISLGAWLRFKHGEHESLSKMSVNPEWYDSAYLYHLDYTVCEFLSKYKGLSIDVDTRGVALRKFIAAELSCKESNNRIKSWLSGKLVNSPDVDWVIHSATRKIAAIFGDCFSSHEFDPRALQEYCRWGPGSTATLRGAEATLDKKICEDPISVTPGAVQHLWTVLMSDPHWLSSRGYYADGPFCPIQEQFLEMVGGRLDTVPKNARTDRTIHIEPSGNIFLQLGVGQFIRRKLCRIGIDLDDQSINQTWASCAYALGLATVDLSAASDSICREAVYLLFPPDVAHYLDDIRSQCYGIEGAWYPFHKWSSMGNGYTFELETLIFWSITQSIVERLNLIRVSAVYGDDIIIDSCGVPLLEEVFRFLGFTMNQEKTHTSGPFYESCGEHYFRGINVTPVYQKEIPDVLEEVYRLANRIRRLAYRMGAHNDADSILRPAWLAACRSFTRGGVVSPPHFIPSTTLPSYVFTGGDWIEDDGGLLLDVSEFPRDVRRTSTGSFSFSVRVFRPLTKAVSDHSGLFAYHLRRWWRENPQRIGLNQAPPSAMSAILWINAEYRDIGSSPFDGTVSIRGRGKYVGMTRNLSVGSNSAWG